MRESCRILYRGGQGELTEKKSRFIANTRPVESEEEAIAFIEEMRKKYWDARHNCSAYVIGTKGQLQRCSDDGEPSGTAGRPMLDILDGQGIYNVVAVVTRYFGGTLLGTGGLVRAYSGAMKEGLNHCVLLEKETGYPLTVTVDYNEVGKIQYLARTNEIHELSCEYGNEVVFRFLVPEEKIDSFETALTEKTAAKAKLERGEKLCYGFHGDEVIQMDKRQEGKES